MINIQKMLLFCNEIVIFLWKYGKKACFKQYVLKISIWVSHWNIYYFVVVERSYLLRYERICIKTVLMMKHHGLCILSYYYHHCWLGLECVLERWVMQPSSKGVECIMNKFASSWHETMLTEKWSKVIFNTLQSILWLTSIYNISIKLARILLAKLFTFSSYIIRAIYIQKVLLDQNGFLSVPVLE